MDQDLITTPFGRRSMTLAWMKHQVDTSKHQKAHKANKWQVYRHLCEAKPLLKVSDRALAVLNALLSFYPETDLSNESGLVVFPSNAQLSLRAHGMAEQTLRRHLAALVEAGLIIRKDSPNGKRYARKGKGGAISQAFGFSLAPLLARSAELEQLAAQVKSHRAVLVALKEQISLFRRDVFKLLETAQETDDCASTSKFQHQFQELLSDLPRTLTVDSAGIALGRLQTLRTSIVNTLDTHINSTQVSGTLPQNERHIHNSHIESYIGFEADASPIEITTAATLSKNEDLDPQVGPTANPAVSLTTLLRACPQIKDYGPGGRVLNWQDLQSATAVVRAMLGISPSAYNAACHSMGSNATAAAIACILERATDIRSAGAYLRVLAQRASRKQFSTGPMISALLRANSAPATTVSPAEVMPALSSAGRSHLKPINRFDIQPSTKPYPINRTGGSIR